MKVKALVTRDDIGEYTTKDGKTVPTRRINCVDLDEDTQTRMSASFRVDIPVNSNMGKNGETASMANCFVELAIMGIRQWEKTKELAFSGRVLSVSQPFGSK